MGIHINLEVGQKYTIFFDGQSVSGWFDGLVYTITAEEGVQFESRWLRLSTHKTVNSGGTEIERIRYIRLDKITAISETILHTDTGDTENGTDETTGTEGVLR